MKIFDTKRGQGLSMNVIIIAAISLLVLVVLAVIFIGRSGTFAEQSSACATQGGQCLESCGNGQFVIPSGTCSTEGEVCCGTLTGSGDDS